MLYIKLIAAKGKTIISLRLELPVDDERLATEANRFYRVLCFLSVVFKEYMPLIYKVSSLLFHQMSTSWNFTYTCKMFSL